MEKSALENYQELMNKVRYRLDAINALKKSKNDYHNCELAAFHGRKIIECIAFGCLIAIENGIKLIPRDAKGQYNAETILRTLEKKGIEVFPSPSIIRKATEQEQKEHNTNVVIEGVAERRITQSELLNKYQRIHNWLHELNPFTKDEQDVFHEKNQGQLWKDLDDLELFLKSHLISIKGEAFFSTIWDKNDNLTKVVSLSKISDLGV